MQQHEVHKLSALKTNAPSFCTDAAACPGVVGVVPFFPTPSSTSRYNDNDAFTKTENYIKNNNNNNNKR